MKSSKYKPQANNNQAMHKKTYGEKKANVVVPIRRNALAIARIDSIKHVDLAISYMTFPTKKYDRDADFHIQDVIGLNKELMSYYHKKMAILFGSDHLIREEYKKLITTQGKNNNADSVPQEAQTWLLDWQCVEFFDGYFIVYSPNPNLYQFIPLKVSCPRALSSFNYIKKYINDKIPAIFCDIYASQLHITSPILIDDAIMAIQKIARQRGITISKKESTSAIETDSFKKALSKAALMTPEEFKKYKSKYIDYLVSKQSDTYKILPCVERLAHSYDEIKEYAFLFSIICKSGNILIVHENVNPDRATIVFIVKKEAYDISIRSIYDFFQGTDINKRSSIREKSIRCKAGIINYNSIDHDDLNTWQKTIEWYMSEAISIPKMEDNLLNAKFSSISQLLREIKTKENFPKVEQIFSEHKIQITRNTRPADLLSRIPDSSFSEDSNGYKKLPIREGEWSIENLIKLLENK